MASLLASSCASHNSVQVSTLDAGQFAEQVVVQRGLTQSLIPAAGFEHINTLSGERSFHSDVQYFETVMSYGLNTEASNTFLMVNAYLSSNQHVQGLAFFEAYLKRYKNNMNQETRATYLSAYAILRATYAEQVPLTSRIGWVNDTFDMLEEASRLTDNKNPIVHWASGLIYAQVPFFFFKKDAAYAELNWLADRPETEPLSGFYREVYHHLARLHAKDGHTKLAEQFLKKSGYEDYEPKSMFMGWFTSSRDKGASMAGVQALKEVVPGRVFALYGFGFSDVYFVVSKDGNELIAIDAGTQPTSLQAAHEFLMARHPDLPPITTAIITHAHWDHIGGLTYLRELNPNLIVYGRENYAGTLDRANRDHSYEQFRSAEFDHEWTTSYRPDRVVAQRTGITLAGSRYELIPVVGGETEDALLVHMPDIDVVFVGDILMPFYGEPWVEEGYIDGAMATMDEVISLNPTQILHGHYPLTFMYGLEPMKEYRKGYEWLVASTRLHIRNGYSAKDIMRLNLIPPGLEKHPEAYASYLAPRDHVIARTADHMVGIWQEDITGKDPEGLYNLTSIEYGRLLEVYLDLSPRQVAKALRKMIKGGDNELALHLALAAEIRYPSRSKITKLKEQAADQLRSSAQYFDPFKFVAYTEMMGKEHKPISLARVTDGATPN